MQVRSSTGLLPLMGKIFYSQKSKMAATNTVTYDKVAPKCHKSTVYSVSKCTFPGSRNAMVTLKMPLD